MISPLMDERIYKQDMPGIILIFLLILGFLKIVKNIK